MRSVTPMQMTPSGQHGNRNMASPMGHVQKGRFILENTQLPIGGGFAVASPLNQSFNHSRNSPTTLMSSTKRMSPNKPGGFAGSIDIANAHVQNFVNEYSPLSKPGYETSTMHMTGDNYRTVMDSKQNSPLRSLR